MHGDWRRLVLLQQQDQFAGGYRFRSLIGHNAGHPMSGDGGIDGCRCGIDHQPGRTGKGSGGLPGAEAKRQLSVSAPSRSMMHACSRNAAGVEGRPWRST